MLAALEPQKRPLLRNHDVLHLKPVLALNLAADTGLFHSNRALKALSLLGFGVLTLGTNVSGVKVFWFTKIPSEDYCHPALGSSRTALQIPEQTGFMQSRQKTRQRSFSQTSMLPTYGQPSLSGRRSQHSPLCCFPALRYLLAPCCTLLHVTQRIAACLPLPCNVSGHVWSCHAGCVSILSSPPPSLQRQASGQPTPTPASRPPQPTSHRGDDRPNSVQTNCPTRIPDRPHNILHQDATPWSLEFLRGVALKSF